MSRGVVEGRRLETPGLTTKGMQVVNKRKKKISFYWPATKL